MSEIVLFQDDNGKIDVNVRLDGDTVWLTQQQMAEVFATTQQNIDFHLKNIFTDGELAEIATYKDFLLVRSEGNRSVSRNIKHYNLDVIISVGYRVNSKQGVAFRKWATNVLNEHLVHGFTLNQKRLADLGVTEAQHVVDLLARTLEKQSGTNRHPITPGENTPTSNPPPRGAASLRNGSETGKRGHFYLAGKGTFLFSVDSA